MRSDQWTGVHVEHPSRRLPLPVMPSIRETGEVGKTVSQLREV